MENTNVIKLLQEHDCTEPCEIAQNCKERENPCLWLETAFIPENIMENARYLYRLGLRLGTNKYADNELLALNKDDAIEALRTLRKEQYTIAVLSETGIYIDTKPKIRVTKRSSMIKSISALEEAQELIKKAERILSKEGETADNLKPLNSGHLLNWTLDNTETATSRLETLIKELKEVSTLPTTFVMLKVTTANPNEYEEIHRLHAQPNELDEIREHCMKCLREHTEDTGESTMLKIIRNGQEGWIRGFSKMDLEDETEQNVS